MRTNPGSEATPKHAILPPDQTRKHMYMLESCVPSLPPDILLRVQALATHCCPVDAPSWTALVPSLVLLQELVLNGLKLRQLNVTDEGPCKQQMSHATHLLSHRGGQHMTTTTCCDRVTCGKRRPMMQYHPAKAYSVCDHTPAPAPPRIHASYVCGRCLQILTTLLFSGKLKEVSCLSLEAQNRPHR